MTDEQKKAGMDGANQMVADLKVMADANAKYRKIYKATAIATTDFNVRCRTHNGNLNDSDNACLLAHGELA